MTFRGGFVLVACSCKEINQPMSQPLCVCVCVPPCAYGSYLVPPLMFYVLLA